MSLFCGLRARGALLTLGLLAWIAVPAASEEPSARQQQIAEVEKQIQELTRKLEELRKASSSSSVPEGTIPPAWVKAMTWRSIGPASMGGRIVALAVYEADPSTYWVATASGGLLKTTNNGVTFEHQFDREATVSIGDVAVAPSDRNIVWVGTGENNPRNSVSYGDGVYKSTDGGKTWKNMGLRKSFQIGKILIHPTNPNTVYVGALGRLYGPGGERGLYKTTDGGLSWKKVLEVDDRTGIIEMRMHPTDPNTLLVASWERLRDGFDSHPGFDVPIAEGYDGYDPIKKWGSGTALYRTTDGGASWKKVTQGLPSGQLGRIGLDWYRKDPKVVFAIVDCDKIGMGVPPVGLGVQVEKVAEGIRFTAVSGNGAASKAGLKSGTVVTALDKSPIKDVESFTMAIEVKKAGDKVTLTVKGEKETKDVVVTLETQLSQGPGQGMPAVFLGLQGEPVEKGLRTSAVRPNSPAAKAGLKEGDIVTTLDKNEVKTTQNVFAALRGKKAGDKLVVSYLRGEKKEEVTLTLEARPGVTTDPLKRPYAYAYGGQKANAQHQQGPEGAQYGGVYRSADGGESWTRINSLNPRPMYFSQIRVDPLDEMNLYVLGISLHRSRNGGKTFTEDGGRGVHPDQHALWVNPRDSRHLIVGCDGGFYASYDRGDHWDFLNNVAIGQFYHVAVDSRRPYRVYGGLQDNGSWGGPSHSRSESGLVNEDWVVINGGDGFVCRVDPTDPDLIYYESQDGMIGRRHLRTGERGFLRPRQPDGVPPYRFNWNTPFILSNHNPRLFYSAGNYVFRSYNRGSDLRLISPEITLTKRGSATALAESPRNPEILWVGSDDGALWVTRDGGKTWTNVTDKVGLPGPRWVSTIEPSRGSDGRCYVVFDGHRSNDDEPYVMMTEDFGQTWKSLRANLPWGSTRVLREDISNPNLLYLGTEFGIWVTLNRGASWVPLNNNLPTVAVHEVAVHPTAGEIVVATHGRSLWVLDITALRQMDADTIKAKARLYAPNTAVQWQNEPARASVYGTGSRHWVGTSQPQGAQIYYSLAAKADKATLKVVDYTGRTIFETQAAKEPGLHHTRWNLVRVQVGGMGPRVPAGMYRVILTVDGVESSQPLKVEDDPSAPIPLIATESEAEVVRKIDY